MLLRHRVRLAANLLNGSTPTGLAVARLGGARLGRCPGGLHAGTGYRLPVPAAPAFTMGNVIITRRPTLDAGSGLFRHEARHATQYAWCGGLIMLPLYFAAAGVSWLLSGDFGAWNVFERSAGLADGGYTARSLRRPGTWAGLAPGLARHLGWPGTWAADRDEMPVEQHQPHETAAQSQRAEATKKI